MSQILNGANAFGVNVVASTTPQPLLKEANNNKNWTNQNENLEVCNCAAFLDPFPNQITWR